MQTTNEKLDEAIAALAELIGWARADMEASYESGAPEQGDSDRQRLSWLMSARRLVEICRR